jgi:bacterioferritin-associated ferredoxin
MSMFDCATKPSCEGCPARLVCRCLQVTEEVIVEAVKTMQVRTVQSLRQCTGAGTGCNACHKTLGVYIARHSLPSVSSGAEPICSVR